MPYIKWCLAGNEFCIHKKEGGDKLGCHPSRKAAQQQIAAIYAHENKQAVLIEAAKDEDGDELWDEAKTVTRFEQSEVNYSPLSPNLGANRACANCRWFESSFPSCLIIKNYPQDILATGYCDEWDASPEPVKPPSMPMSMSMERHDDAPEHVHDEPEIGYIAPDSNAVGRLKALSGKLKHGLKPGQSVFKGADGKRYMLIVTSNSYQDRDNETITTQALQQYVDTCWKSVEGQFVSSNPLLFWHDDRLVMGDIIYADMKKAFLVEIARENDAPLSRLLFDYREAHPDESWGASHRFAYMKAHKDSDGTYHAIQKRETSTLPRDAAANVLTFSGVVPMPSKRDEYLNKMLGLENAAELLDKGIDVLMAELSKRGIDHKSSDKPETQPDYSHLLTDIIKGQGEFVDELDALKTQLQTQAAELTATKASNASLQEANTKLTERMAEAEKSLKARPRVATQDKETEISPDILPDQIKAALEEKDSFFKLPVTKKV